MGTLGSGEYEVFVRDSTTEFPLFSLDHSSLQWQRVRSAVSVGSVVVPQLNVNCENLNRLRGWDQLMSIERDGEIVWDGPIMGWSVSPEGDVTIDAKDRWAEAGRRYIGLDRDYTGTPTAAGTIVNNLLADALLGNVSYDPYAMSIPSFLTSNLGALVTGINANQPKVAYKVAELKKVADALDELGVFYTMLGSQLINVFANVDATGYWSGLYSGVPWDSPVLGEATTFGAPPIKVDYSELANVFFEGQDVQGLNGFPVITNSEDTYGRPLTHVHGRLEGAKANSTLPAFAQPTVGNPPPFPQDAINPNITIEKIRLAPEFGSRTFRDDLSLLIPGMTAWVDFENTCGFNVPWLEQMLGLFLPGDLRANAAITQVRLQQLDVEVSADGDEKVLGSFIPVLDRRYDIDVEYA